MEVPVLVSNYKTDLRFSHRDENYGGDDWSTPWMKNIISNLVPAYSNSNTGLLFNDISNMNGGYFKPHIGHDKGDSVDLKVEGMLSCDDDKIPCSGIPIVNDEKIMDKILNVLNDSKYGSYIKGGYLTFDGAHTFDKNNKIIIDINDKSYNEQFRTWNRLRHQCLADGRLARTVLLSDYPKNHHKTHFHLDFLENPITDIPDILLSTTKNIDLRMSFPGAETIEFYPPIFTGTNVDYEVYAQVPTSYGYNEFAPYDAVAANLSQGPHLLKLLKIFRLPDGTTRCSQQIASQDGTIIKPDLEAISVQLKDTPTCDSSLLKPVRNNISVYPNGIPDNLKPYHDIYIQLQSADVGYVVPGSTVSPDSIISSRAYVCAGSNILGNSNIGLADHVEVTRSNVTQGTTIIGNVDLQDTNIAHTSITGTVSVDINDNWIPPQDSDIARIKFADIADKTTTANDQLTQKVVLMGFLNLTGTSDARINLSATSDVLANNPLNIPNSSMVAVSKGSSIVINGSNPIVNSNLLVAYGDFLMVNGGNQQTLVSRNIKINNASQITNSTIEDEVLIDSGSTIIGSLIFEGINDSTAEKISITNSSKILGSDILLSSDNDAALLIENSTVSNSSISSSLLSTTITGSTVANSPTVSNTNITGSTVKNSSEVWSSNITGGSAIDQSDVTDLSLDNSNLTLTSAWRDLGNNPAPWTFNASNKNCQDQEITSDDMASNPGYYTLAQIINSNVTPNYDSNKNIISYTTHYYGMICTPK